MSRVLTQREQADLANAGMRFEKKYKEALGDSWREELRQKTVALYAADPRCAVCKEEIESSDRAMLWEPANGKAFIICNRGECNAKALNDAVDRYIGKVRRSA